MENYLDAEKAIKAIKPTIPLHIIRKASLNKAAVWFKRNFHGKVLFAVKTNSNPIVLKQLHESGIEHFDVASIAEVKLVAENIPAANMYFMHPVKPREAIRDAYFTYGVRDFSLDSYVELQKILEATNHAEDLNLHIRLSIPNDYAELGLTRKFGADIETAPELLWQARKFANKLGLCFHVGSQNMHPNAFKLAIEIAGRVVKASEVNIDVMDVGGGFPAKYPDLSPPPMKDFTQSIHREFMRLNLRNEQGKPVELWCEPGRALVAESGSVVVRVDLRKGDALYINDGTYGSLFDAGVPQFTFPVKMIRIKGKKTNAQLVPFQFYGPTCDSADFMKGPFMLPEDIGEGDYIEVQQLGAYGGVFRTDFNGFGAVEFVETEDKPMMSMYRKPKTVPLHKEAAQIQELLKKK